MLQELGPYILPAVIALAALLVFLSQYFNGKDKARANGEQVSSEVISAYTVQVQQLKDQRIEDKASYEKSIANYTTQVTHLSGEVGRLNGIISEKDKQLEKYETIFQNRNPDLTNVLTDIKNFMVKLNTTLVAVDDRTKKSEERDAKIDHGHVVAATSA